MSDRPPETRRIGCGWYLAFWIVPEIVWAVLVAFLGPDTTPLIVGGALLIAFVVGTVFIIVRVLRGHDL